MKVRVIQTSLNRKIGNISAIYSENITCPSTCPLKDSGCYARFGMAGLHWRNLPDSWAVGMEKVRALPNKSTIRYGVAGDMPGVSDKIDDKKLSELLESVGDNTLYAYTHKPVLNHKFAKSNAALIKAANSKDNVTINLSADSLAEADEMMDLQIAPVVVVIPEKSPNTLFTPKGRKVIACPQQNNDKITCASCRLCMKKRSVIIGFKAHGTGKKKIKFD